jgi:hypothetical protein
MGPNKYRNQDTRTLTETQVNSSLQSSDRREGRDILARIVETKLEEISLLEGRRRELRDLAENAPTPHSFFDALTRPDTVALIAEVKRRGAATRATARQVQPSAGQPSAGQPPPSIPLPR